MEHASECQGSNGGGRGKGEPKGPGQLGWNGLDVTCQVRERHRCIGTCGTSTLSDVHEHACGT